jgi:uncharacterized protein YkwD
MKQTVFFALFFVFAGIFSCEDNKNFLDAPKDPDSEKLLELVNDVREKGCDCGGEYQAPASPVVWNDKLEQAAQNHSNDMDENNFMKHDGSDGSSPGDRIVVVGYSWSTYGENIANGYTSESAVIQGWLDSPGHCKNIMNAKFTEMGVATSGSYWTMVLAKPE